MRVIRTYVLRLLVDSDEPHALRGLVHSVASGEEHPFADGPTLLELLRQMAGGAAWGDGPYDGATNHREGSEL